MGPKTKTKKCMGGRIRKTGGSLSRMSALPAPTKLTKTFRRPTQLNLSPSPIKVHHTNEPLLSDEVEFMGNNGVLYRFNKKENIGKGAYGNVYIGKSEDGTSVAIKEYIPRSVMPSDKIRNLLVNEFSVLHKLGQHPNILQMYAYRINTDDQYSPMYGVYKHLSGHVNLVDNHKNNALWCKNEYRPEIVINIVNKLCGVINYMHEHGIAHRDIKPENIMIHVETFNVVLIDFGLACMNAEVNVDCDKNVGTKLWKESMKSSSTLEDHMNGDNQAMLLLVIYLLNRCNTVWRHCGNPDDVFNNPVTNFFSTFVEKSGACVEEIPLDKINRMFEYRFTLSGDNKNEDFHENAFKVDIVKNTHNVSPIVNVNKRRTMSHDIMENIKKIKL